MNVAEASLRARAAKTVPGGMYGHKNVAHLPAGYPQFFQKGLGASIWDVDGREYIDLMCSWGPIILGHQNPIVDEAVRRQLSQGECFNGPTERMVELAELLTDTVVHADWALFCKNGTDATTLAVAVARAETSKRKVIIANGSYHGIAAWSSKPEAAGIPEDERANQIRIEYNDVASLRAAVDAAGGDLAAVVLTPMRHDVFRNLEPVSREFAQAARELCDRNNAVLILDEVRTGFRIDPAGSWAALGVQPDLSAWSKAIGNGHALAALLGTRALETAATRITATGSFWFGSVPMAAALATIQEIRRPESQALLAASGTKLQQGLLTQAASHGLDVTVSGPSALPFMTFANDPEFELSAVWAKAALDEGVYFHPTHNWFLGTAHTDAVIDKVLNATDVAFAQVAPLASRRGSDDLVRI
ncbi:aminotransferase class III-fold pyridoxal phosphate-dependent enzyme [Diaminobutyricibacter sp. McL0618]|uniref:aminotransferase class III-fold pyridoxal phosphate-dependent enzyme n=1 Tax=Leifsonia sp. McL0618 TaxID=3415677 RepID=UPI003CE779D7